MPSRSLSLTALCSLLALGACGQATTTVDDDAPDASGGDDVAPDADPGGDDDVPDAEPSADAEPPPSPDASLTCAAGTCAVGGACATDVPDIGYEPGDTGNRWFGGDDRDLDGDGTIDIRSVGAGESFVASDPMSITRVGLYFDAGFHSEATSTAHGAVVALELRDAGGTVIASAAKLVPAAFTGGWVRWDLDANVAAGTYVLTAYVPGVFGGQNYTAYIRTDYANGFAGGTAYGKEVQTGGAMGDWTDWQADPGVDHAFSIAAACPL